MCVFIFLQHNWAVANYAFYVRDPIMGFHKPWCPVLFAFLTQRKHNIFMTSEQIEWYSKASVSGASATKEYFPFSPLMKVCFQVPFVFQTLPIKMLIHSKGNSFGCCSQYRRKSFVRILNTTWGYFEAIASNSESAKWCFFSPILLIFLESYIENVPF